MATRVCGLYYHFTLAVVAVLVVSVGATGRSQFARTILGLGTDALTAIVTANDGSVFYAGSSSFAYYSTNRNGVDTFDTLVGRGDFFAKGPFNASSAAGLEGSGGCDSLSNNGLGCPCNITCTWIHKISPTSGELLWSVDPLPQTVIQGMVASHNSQYLYVIGESILRFDLDANSRSAKYTTLNVFVAKLSAANGKRNHMKLTR